MHTWVAEGIVGGYQPVLCPNDRRAVLRRPPTRAGRLLRRAMRLAPLLHLPADVSWAGLGQPLWETDIDLFPDV